MRVIDRFITAIRSAAIFNPDVQVAPACILWPDSDRQWQSIISRLQQDIPELLILGDYNPSDRTGPAIWLRCVLARTLDPGIIPQDATPILYLPGVSRQDLRAVENCPTLLKPLAELQYRGVIWSQINGKDWTILAFLKSDQGGLGLTIAQDQETKTAMQLALDRFLDEELSLLQDKHLDKDYFNTLLTGGDPTRDLLRWLDQGETFQNGCEVNVWQGFISICESQFGFNPHRDGLLNGAKKLAEQTGPWKAVWDRFCEAPKRYPNIPKRIRQCQPPNHTLFWNSSEGNSSEGDFSGWPQWNEKQEEQLRQTLMTLKEMTPGEARTTLQTLETHHAHRRSLVWVELGESPLVQALEALAQLADRTQISLTAGSPAELASRYQNQGWEADDAVLRALAVVDKTPDQEAVTLAIRAIYLPWAEDAARYLQQVVDQGEYPGGTIKSRQPPTYQEGECVLFVDGLRFDVAKRLKQYLAAEFQVAETIVWTALPSVTATGKAAVSPIQMDLRGEDQSVDFEPCLADTGKSLKGGYHLKKRLKEQGWHILDRSNLGNGQGKAWYEFGDIDHEGHDRGWKLAKHIDSLLREIQEQIRMLLEAGWQRIRIVTDHGWLLVPGGLPKVDLPSVLTETRWGRCAALKPGVKTDERLFPWFWNPNQYFALADGISCFRRGEEYAHGGLSLQECLCLELTVTANPRAQNDRVLEITDMVWLGLRCKVAVEGDCSDLFLDIREQPGNPASSVVMGIKPFKSDGTSSVVVENEDWEGRSATLVLLNGNNQLVAQSAVVIGKNK